MLTTSQDEEDPISDFSESVSDCTVPTAGDVTTALRSFNREIQREATQFVAKPHDSLRLRKFERWVDEYELGEEQKVRNLNVSCSQRRWLRI